MLPIPLVLTTLIITLLAAPVLAQSEARPFTPQQIACLTQHGYWDKVAAQNKALKREAYRMRQHRRSNTRILKMHREFLEYSTATGCASARDFIAYCMYKNPRGIAGFTISEYLAHIGYEE